MLHRLSHAVNKVLKTSLLTLPLFGCSNQPTADAELSYQSQGATLTLHYFKPKGTAPENGWPSVLFFHGGAWQVGHPRQFFPQCEQLVNHGIACFSAQYRLAKVDNTGVKEAYADAAAAFRYLLSNAQTLSLDSSKISVSGGSAGGHLAALLATGGNGLAPHQVAALLLFNPMIDLRPGYPDHQFVSDYWEQVSPYHQLQQKLPPTLVMLGDQDTELPVPVAQAFCDKAKQFGSTCQMDVAAGKEHGFFNPQQSQQEFERTLALSLDFLAAHGLN